MPAAIDENALLKRITVDPERCGGRPTIRGMRIRVSDVLDMLATGETAETILAEYPYLEGGRSQGRATLWRSRHRPQDRERRVTHRFLIDAQLPIRLARWFERARDLKPAMSRRSRSNNASDREIWRYAAESSAVIVSKDADFAQLAAVLARRSSGSGWEMRPQSLCSPRCSVACGKFCWRSMIANG